MEPMLLARAITKLENVNLSNTSLQDDQILAIFLAISRNSQLKKLNIGHNNLYSVDPQLMVSAVSKLEEALMFSTGLSSQKMKTVLTTSKLQTSLKRMLIARPGSCAWVDRDLLLQVGHDIMLEVKEKDEDVEYWDGFGA